MPPGFFRWRNSADDRRAVLGRSRARAASCRSTRFHLPRRLRRTVAPRRLRGRAATAISPRSCAAAPRRPRSGPRPGSTTRSSRLYAALHRQGHAHSVEAWHRRRSWSAGSTAWRWAARSSARACSAASPTPARSRSPIWSRGSDPRRLRAARHPIRDRASRRSSARSRFRARAIAAGSTEALGGDRPISRRRARRRRGGVGFAVEHVDVVDRVLHRRHRRARGEHPAAEDALRSTAVAAGPDLVDDRGRPRSPASPRAAA